MIRINDTESRVYEMLKMNRNQEQIEKSTGKGRTWVLRVLHKLVKQELAEVSYNGRNPVFKAIVKEYKLVNRKSRVKANRIGILREMVRKYGKDNVRFIAYQHDSPLSYISKKTGIPEHEVSRVVTRLSNVS